VGDRLGPPDADLDLLVGRCLFVYFAGRILRLFRLHGHDRRESTGRPTRHVGFDPLKEDLDLPGRIGSCHFICGRIFRSAGQHGREDTGRQTRHAPPVVGRPRFQGRRVAVGMVAAMATVAEQQIAAFLANVTEIVVHIIIVVALLGRCCCCCCCCDLVPMVLLVAPSAGLKEAPSLVELAVCAPHAVITGAALVDAGAPGARPTTGLVFGFWFGFVEVYWLGQAHWFEFRLAVW